MIENSAAEASAKNCAAEASAENSVRDVPRDLAIVTGAGAGLGRALCVELTNRGIRVAGLGRQSGDLEETQRRCRADLFACHVVDVADASAVKTVFAEIASNGAPVSILFNSAAVYPKSDFLRTNPDELMRVVSINLGGFVNCASCALQSMVESGRGRIINVATFADLAPLPGSMAYSVSKGAARIFTRALVADIGDRFPDIIINDWIPGALATRMGISDGIAPDVAAKWGVQLALMRDRELNGVTFERNFEVLSPRSLKRKVKDLVLFQKPPVPRHL